MKEFEDIVSSEIKQENKSQEKTEKTSLREVALLVLQSKPTIDHIRLIDDEKMGCKNGNIVFEVPMTSLGLNYNILRKYKKEIFSHVFVDLMAEIIVRENIEQFISNITSLGVDDYKLAANSLKHETFGMKVQGLMIVFSFHMSFLQDILMEDFKTQIK